MLCSQLIFIHQKIQASTQLAHRPKSAVTLLAVSKTKPNEAILEAYQAGHHRLCTPSSAHG